MATIILDGFDPPTRRDLARILIGEGHDIAVGEAETVPADALFCNADTPLYPFAIKRVRAVRPDLPVIVVTARQEQELWLDALEAGAADYCCAPFDTGQLSRLLAGVLREELKPTDLSHV